MPRSDRMFEIIQILRCARNPLRGSDLAEVLEVSKRTVYRDIAALQAMRTPIQGEPGVGYVLRKGYDLPPVNLDADEAEAITVGLSLIARTGDPGLFAAAQRAARKLAEAAPDTTALIASNWGTPVSSHIDPGDLRAAIRSETMLELRYSDAKGAETRRTVWPLVLIYYAETTVLVAWCTLRRGFRHFRLDRIAACSPLSDDFIGQGSALRTEWEATLKADTVTTGRP